jgi:hypothetical protein
MVAVTPTRTTVSLCVCLLGAGRGGLVETQKAFFFLPSSSDLQAPTSWYTVLYRMHSLCIWSVDEEFVRWLCPTVLYIIENALERRFCWRSGSRGCSVPRTRNRMKCVFLCCVLLPFISATIPSAHTINMLLLLSIQSHRGEHSQQLHTSQQLCAW